MTVMVEDQRPASELTRDELRVRLGLGPPVELRPPLRYLSRGDVQMLLGYKQPKTIIDLEEIGGIIAPDVYIDDHACGWDPQWLHLWAVETGRMSQAGKPLKKRGGRRPLGYQRPRWWDVDEPGRYVGSASAGRLLGMNPNTAYMRRREGKFPEPDVMIGDRPGWRRSTIEAFGRRKGKIPLDGALVAGAATIGRPKESDDGG